MTCSKSWIDLISLKTHGLNSRRLDGPSNLLGWTLFFTLIFAVLLLKYKYYANDEFSFTITTNQTRFFCRRRWKSNDLKVIALCMFPRWWSPASWILSKCYILTNLSKNTLPMLLYCQIWWQSVERFKSYNTLFNYKMASAAILDFVKILYLIKFSKSASAMVLSRQVWWQSVERFKNYSTLFIYKMASAILDFEKILCLTTLSWRMLGPDPFSGSESGFRFGSVNRCDLLLNPKPDSKSDETHLRAGFTTTNQYGCAHVNYFML